MVTGRPGATLNPGCRQQCLRIGVSAFMFARCMGICKDRIDWCFLMTTQCSPGGEYEKACQSVANLPLAQRVHFLVHFLTTSVRPRPLPFQRTPVKSVTRRALNIRNCCAYFR